MSPTTTRIQAVSAITNLVRLRTDPPTLLVAATGWVSTSGWNHPALIPLSPDRPTADGILEFDFVAERPGGIVLQVQMPVAAQASLPDLPAWVRGVRILAETGTVEQLFPTFPGPAMIEGDIDEEEKAVALTDAGQEAEVELLLIDEAEGYHGAAVERANCREFLLASVDIPEFKTESEVRCILRNPLTGRCVASGRVPVFYRRTSRQRLLVRICLPDARDIWREIEDCVRQAVMAGIAVGVLSGGNLAAAAAALKAYLLACLKAKLGAAVDDISVDLRRERIAGPWKRV